MLKGFWCANASFCQDADLDWFVLYIGDDDGIIKHSRYGYICVANHDGIIINSSITINFGLSTAITPGLSHCKTYNINIEWDDDEPDIEDVFPSNLQLTYYPKYGKIVLYKNDTVKAILWKDLQTSAISSTEEMLPRSIAKEKDGDDIGDDDTDQYHANNKYEDL
jgi:hypothetical protein